MIVIDCICEWPEGCAGIGILFCDGCGGDMCFADGEDCDYDF